MTVKAPDVAPEHLALLRRLILQHLGPVTVWAYGSRVQGTALQYSDLDLAVFCDSGQTRQLNDLRDELMESNLPFIVQIHRFHSLPEDFQAVIRGCHLVIMDGAETSAPPDV